MPRVSWKIASCGLALMLLTLCGARTAAAQQEKETLYDRLGGYDRLAAIVDNFVGRLGSDPRFVRFFAGYSRDSRRRRRQLIVNQLCEAAGGPCYYTGRSMRTAHRGLGISEEAWEATVQHLTATLDHFQVPQKEKEELLAIVNGTKADIVESSESSPPGYGARR